MKKKSSYNFDKKHKILVIGSSGLIGKSLVNGLIKKKLNPSVTIY